MRISDWSSDVCSSDLLEKSLQFDPLLREIDKLANGMEELPFGVIIAGINSEKAAMDALQPSNDEANRALEQQKKAVEEATKARDAISGRYDEEQKKLSQLNDAYSLTRDRVNEIEQSLRDMGQAASEEIQKLEALSAGQLTPGGQNFQIGRAHV